MARIPVRGEIGVRAGRGPVCAAELEPADSLLLLLRTDALLLTARADAFKRRGIKFETIDRICPRPREVSVGCELEGAAGLLLDADAGAVLVEAVDAGADEAPAAEVDGAGAVDVAGVVAGGGLGGRIQAGVTGWGGRLGLGLPNIASGRL